MHPCNNGLSAAVLAENSLIHFVAEIFHPVFVVVATGLAAIFAVIPNYAVAIILLTVIVMLLLTPLTVKSTKSMIAMRRLQPEIKRLQQKYKGLDNRQQLNEELMRLYKEQGISPAGGCIPLFLQMPFLVILYDVIKGLANTVQGQARPLYIPSSSRLFRSLVAAEGKMNAWGMNIALKPLSHHASVAAALPFFALIAIAVALQFVQMRQINQRTPPTNPANRQVQVVQWVTPILFAYIYFLVPAAVVLYMIVSTIIRIATQALLGRDSPD